MADCRFCCCKLTRQRALIAPRHPRRLLRYTIVTTEVANSPALSRPHPRLRGLEWEEGGEKKINNGAKWGGVRGQQGP